MRKPRVARPSPAMVVAIVALVVALGGGAYAATKIPKKSVGTKQLKGNAVTKVKIADGAVTNAKIANGAITPAKISSTGGSLPIGFATVTAGGTLFQSGGAVLGVNRPLTGRYCFRPCRSREDGGRQRQR